jgi:hypothetical protein
MIDKDKSFYPKSYPSKGLLTKPGDY